MVRGLAYTLLSLFSVFIVVLLTVFLLLVTETGSRWLVNKALTYTPGNLTIERMQGSLLSGLNLYKVDQYIDQHHIQIRHVVFNLQPRALLRGKVLIRNLKISGINYTVEDTKGISTSKNINSPQKITFPLPIVIQKGRLDNLNFNQGDLQYSLDYINLTGQISKKGFLLERLDAHGENIDMALKKAHIVLQHPYPFQAEANWSLWLPDRVSAKGRSDISGDIEFVKFTHKLIEPLDLNMQGEVKIRHKMDEMDQTTLFEMILKSDLIVPGLPPARIETNVQTDFRTLQFSHVIVHMLDGILKASGHIEIQPEPKGEFIVSAMDIDPGAQWSGWPGKLTLNTNVQCRIEDGKPIIIFDEVTAAGYLLTEPFKAEGDLTIVGKKMIVEEFGIHLGENQLNVSGTIAEDLDLRFNLNTPDPVKLWPGIKGHFLTNGVLKGTIIHPIGVITLEGNNISYGKYTLQNIEADFVFDTENSRNSNGRYRLGGLRVADKSFSDVSLAWSGDFKQHKVNFDFVSTASNGDLEFVGACQKDGCELTFGKASFDVQEHGKWHLLDPVTLFISRPEIKPFNACWVQRKSTMCAQSSWNDKSGWSLEGNVSDSPLKDIIDLMQAVFKEENLGWKKHTDSKISVSF